MENKILTKAIEVVKDAIAADKAENYNEACELYLNACEYFQKGLKYEQNPQRKEQIKGKLTGYIERAEELTAFKNKEKKRLEELEKNPGKGGAEGTKKKGDKEEDEEQAKLRGALAGAVVTEKPNIKWTDVAGLESAKESLKETVILPVKFPQLFTGKRRPFKGILLFGPPGTGKSYLAKAVATEADSTFFSVSSSDLVSKWQGESEKLVRNLFEMAREAGKAIIFIDEVDSLCGSRSEGESDSARRIKTEFLVQMDGVGKGHNDVLVLGATNVPWELDSAIRRRFEKRIYIPLPEPSARTYMLKLNVGDTPNSLTDEDFDNIGLMTEGASGSDIAILVNEALMEPLRKCQQAKQFLPISGEKSNENPAGEYLTPCTEYPNCPHCPPRLTSDPPNEEYTCVKCHSKRMSLWDVPTPSLKAPDVCLDDFKKTLEHSHSSVSPEELERFVEWTHQFGQEGV